MRGILPADDDASITVDFSIQHCESDPFPAVSLTPVR
jgi:hypothetical protein